MLFFPYQDDNPTRTFPIVNWLLLALNLWVFLAWQLPLERNELEAYFSIFGFTPDSFFGQLSDPDPKEMAWEWCTVFTSTFSHGDIFHLLGNMLFLYLFGDNLEDAMGKIRYLLFYLCCGLLAALAQGLADPDSSIPMVGASGAISGVMAGYLLIYPRANVRFFYWLFIFIGTICLPAYLLLGFWLFTQVLALPESMEQAGGVAVAAHLGGFGAGLVLTPFFKQSGVRMFQSGYSRPFSRNIRKMR
ncbi:MAG: rhomboid family intramembrane serine protease [Opitutae bacterium]|jgi:membrane associated rhomboid family serine protease|nr:rhomboid family intramembrane serine protease [Opitutae bacterium]